MGTSNGRLVVDTDTASDDAFALLIAALSDRVEVEGVTTVAGNVPLDRATENAKHVLDMAGCEAPVFEGSGEPLLKGFETAEDVHGQGGLGGTLRPETDIPSGDDHAVEYLLRASREHDGELTVLCLGPLTNVALAIARDPGFADRIGSLWIMGGAVNTVGNVTPAAEFNFWVDPDAAKRVLRSTEHTLVDWGLSVRAASLGAETTARIEAAAEDSRYAEFFATVVEGIREVLPSGDLVEPDPLATALLVEPDLIAAAETYHADVDERSGMTRGYSLVDENRVTDGVARTRVIESADADGFARLFADTMIHGDPHVRERR